MSGLGGLNKSANGVVLGLVQLQLPVVKTPADLDAQTKKICAMVAKARRNMPTLDLVVFPEIWFAKCAAAGGWRTTSISWATAAMWR